MGSIHLYGRALIALLILCSCSPPPPPVNAVRRPAQAAPPPSAGGDDARRSADLGTRLYGERKYTEALVAFEQAYRLGHQPSALLGVAQCQRAAQEAILELAALTGTLAVDVSEADAEVEVDARPWGRTPLAKPRRVRVATHTVRVTKPGYSTFELAVGVAPQEAKKVEVKLDVDKSAGSQQLSEAERKSTARAAFAEGVELQGRGECPRFETAEKLYDAPTHLLHRAQCQATLGKLVEAQESYATLDHVLSTQSPDAFREAQEAGRAELARLKPRVPTLRLETIPPAGSLKNLVVQVNGSRIPSDVVGIARPVNPGKYHVMVTAGAGRTGSADAEIKEGEARAVEVRLSR